MLIAALLALQPVVQSPADATRPPVAQGSCPGGAPTSAGDCARWIFFDSGETEIRREWNVVVEEAAALARSGASLRVTGHSDTPGSAATNERVALARARVVADALKALGVAAERITIGSDGERNLLVPTAEGVREIQNRRVSIEIRR